MATKKPGRYDAFRAYVREVCLEFKELFHVQEYSLFWDWAETDDGPDPDDHSSNDAAVTISTDTKYLRATITSYKPLYEAWKDGNFDDVNEYLLHEFCHILTEPFHEIMQDHCPPQLQKYCLDIVERQTERVKNVIMNVKRSVEKTCVEKLEKSSE
jgi:hypothetical protein